jgi:hypothetical protein
MPSDLWFIDSGGQHYDGTTMNQKWTEWGNVTAVSSGGSQNQGYLSVVSFGGGAMTLDYNATTIYVGGRFRFTNTVGGSFAGGIYVFEFLDDFAVQVGLKVRDDGRLAIMRGAVTPVELAASTFSLQLGIWYFIEFKATIGDSGSAEGRVGEVTVVTASGDTQQTTNAFLTQVNFIGTPPAGFSPAFGDLYIHKTAFQGDVNIGVIKPNGVGSFTDWTVVGAATGWQANDDIPPNGDTDYVTSTTTTHKFSHEMEDVVLTGPCKGIQVLVSTRKTDSNVRKLKTLLRNSGGSTSEGEAFSIPSTYVYARTCLDTSPFSVSPWTETEINGLQAGAHLVL